MLLFDYDFRKYNFRMVLYMLTLSAIGILTIWSATNQNAAAVRKQIMGIGIGLFLAVVLSLIDYHKILSMSTMIYLSCVVMLVAVLLMGTSRGIATRWIVLPVIGQIQPAEFVKIGLILFFSWYFGKYQDRKDQPSVLGAAALLFAIPAFLIFQQPNLSTTLVVTVIIASVVFASEVSYKWVFGVLAVAVPAALLIIYLLRYDMIPFIEQYQANRILAWIDPEKYAEAYYQQENSIMAIGSGRLWGKGLSNTEIASVKNGNFLIEEQTDFIFAIVGEEMGFAGAMGVMALLLVIVIECLVMASRAGDLPGRLICVGMATLFAFQSFANIAVATAIFPNTGLPLPLISSGVSSLLSIYIGMGVVLNVGLQRKTREDY